MEPQKGPDLNTREDQAEQDSGTPLHMHFQSKLKFIHDYIYINGVRRENIWKTETRAGSVFWGLFLVMEMEDC